MRNSLLHSGHILRATKIWSSGDSSPNLDPQYGHVTTWIGMSRGVSAKTRPSARGGTDGRVLPSNLFCRFVLSCLILLPALRTTQLPVLLAIRKAVRGSEIGNPRGGFR